MNPPERWTSLEIDAADAPPMAPPEPGRHVVVFTASPTVRSGGWSARAALEIARGWGAAGARIVLADLALEEPALHGAAGLDNLEGVSDALLFGTSFQRLGQPLSDGLYLVTAGTAVPDGEALRSHPRWRDFVEGFREADAVLALYVPTDAPGVDVLLEMADGVIVLCTEEEAGEPYLEAGGPVLAALGPERVREDDLGGTGEPSAAAATPFPDDRSEPDPDAGAEEDTAGADPGPRVPAAEGEPDGADAGPGPSDAVAEFLEEVDVAPVDPEMRVAAEAAAGGAPTLDEILDDGDRSGEEETVPEGASAPADTSIPSESRVGQESDPVPGPAAPSRPERTGPSPALLALLALVVVAVLVAAFLGLVEIPGITPSTGGVEEAGAAEVQAAEATRPAAPAAGAEVTAESGNPLLSHVLAIGSFADLETARERIRAIELAAPDVRLVIAPVEVDGHAYFRLLAGPTATPGELESLRDALVPALGGRVEGITREARLAYLMGTAPRLPLAERRRDVLSRLGIPAYVLRVTGSDGEYRYRVYSGAYANPLEARYLAGVLQENDIGGAPLTERRGVWPE